ncbi:MAG: LL-diaminopimelate aminotransferase [Armatimonadetes bacterium]|nr:LL-diaminopimelate aminotransferase [Armatimonadota bacterium]
MQVADRLLRTPPYPFAELGRLKRKAIADGVDLIDFGIGDPDQPTPAHIVEALQRAAADPKTHQYDETGRGLPVFRNSVASWYQQRFGIQLDPDTEVLRVIGAKEALAHLPWAVLNPDDIALVPDPAYPVYNVASMFAGAEVYRFPLVAESGYLPDLAAIPTDVLERAKLLYLCYPNMPTGSAAPLAFYGDLVAFAREHEILICLDMAYSELYYDNAKPYAMLEVEGAKDVAIEIHSLSKTYNMTGWRLGFAVGNVAALDALDKIKSNVDSGVFLAIQEAGAAALSSSQDCVEAMRALYQRRRDLLVDGLAEIGWEIPKPSATCYVWAPCPQGYDSAGLAETLLSEAGVLATPGSAYGKHGEGYVRFSLTVQGERQEERIVEAVGRIREKVKLG